MQNEQARPRDKRAGERRLGKAQVWRAGRLSGTQAWEKVSGKRRVAPR